MRTKHTPGPLEIRVGGNFVAIGRPGFNQRADASGYIGADSGAVASAELRHGYTPTEFAEAEANMRLFSAAPRMYELLKKLAAATLPFGDEPNDIDDGEVLEARAILAEVDDE